MKISIDDKISIYENSNMELFSIIKNVLEKIDNGGKLIPYVLFQHFESMARYKGSVIRIEECFRDFNQYDNLINRGKKLLFFKGFFDIFPEMKNWGDDLKYSTINILWRFGRNGLYHSGILEKNIRLNDQMKEPINSHKGIGDYSIRENPIIEINPYVFTNRIVLHFKTYISALRNEKNKYDIYREEFESRFDDLYSDYTIEKSDIGYLLKMNITIKK